MLSASVLPVFGQGLRWRTPVRRDIVRLAPYQRSYRMARGVFLLSFNISVWLHNLVFHKPFCG
jgi:hypothetical protein